MHEPADFTADRARLRKLKQRSKINWLAKRHSTFHFIESYGANGRLVEFLNALGRHFQRSPILVGELDADKGQIWRKHMVSRVGRVIDNRKLNFFRFTYDLDFHLQGANRVMRVHLIVGSRRAIGTNHS